MIWVFFKDGTVKDGTEDPGDCPKVKCATFREKRIAKELLGDAVKREKWLQKKIRKLILEQGCRQG